MSLLTLHQRINWKKVLIVLLVVSTVILLLYTALLFYVDSKTELDTAVTSDVILVLGQSAYSGTSCYGPICRNGFVPNPHYNPCLVARVNHAVSLYNNHLAPKILMSGGTDKEDNNNEAETMKKIAVEAGVPEADILMEKESSSTYENFAFSQALLAKAGLRSVIIVTDPYHNARAELVASKLHYQYSLSPVTESICWDKDNSFSKSSFRKEPFALIIYKLSRKI